MVSDKLYNLMEQCRNLAVEVQFQMQQNDKAEAAKLLRELKALSSEALELLTTKQ